MVAGIAPTLLRSQVDNTAGWALRNAEEQTPWLTALRSAGDIESMWARGEGELEYICLLLAAHFATVATFVPTDVDSRIRFHAWQDLRNRELLRGAVEITHGLDAWDPRSVSARVVSIDGRGAVSGHDGEWLSVRAGALGRALALGMTDLVDALMSRIVRELEREADLLASVATRAAAEVTALQAATIVAHNCGDLSRVVEAWVVKTPAAKEIQRQLARLGHEGPERFDGWFCVAGRVNKAIMANENHRFLVLRSPRALRAGRELLLPIGPFFDDWGETLGRTRLLDADGRAAALGALLEGHETATEQQGYLRAIAGMHRTAPGGVDALAKSVPARMRKLLSGGAVREALRVEPERFRARMSNRYRAVR